MFIDFTNAVLLTSCPLILFKGSRIHIVHRATASKIIFCLDTGFMFLSGMIQAFVEWLF